MPPGIPSASEAPSARQSHGASWLHLNQHHPAQCRCQGLVYPHKMRARAPQRQHPRPGRANLCALLAGDEQTVTFKEGDCGTASYCANFELWIAVEMWARLTLKAL